MLAHGGGLGGEKNGGHVCCLWGLKLGSGIARSVPHFFNRTSPIFLGGHAAAVGVPGFAAAVAAADGSLDFVI